MNYLELCNYTVNRCGIAGAHNAITAVRNQTGRAHQVTDWVKAADMEIQRKWNNWTFHNRQQEIAWTAGVQFLDEVSSGWNTQVARYSENGFAGRTSDYSAQIPFIAWQYFRDGLSSYSRSTDSGLPRCITADPSGRLQIVPTDISFVLTAEVHMKPYEMFSDTDISPIPPEYHELIMHGAAVMYFAYEEAWDMAKFHESRYDQLMQQLESVCTPNGDRTNITEDESPRMVVPA